MKNKIWITLKLGISFYAMLCLVFFSSCHNHIDDFTVVKSIEANTDSKRKYKVELDFFIANQYLYTDTVFAVSDTLWLRKKH